MAKKNITREKRKKKKGGKSARVFFMAWILIFLWELLDIPRKVKYPWHLIHIYIYFFYVKYWVKAPTFKAKGLSKIFF